MSALQCPACGHVLLVIEGEAAGYLGQRVGAEARAAGEDEIGVSNEGGRWRLECPSHGWHAARAWAAKGEMPAVVKCTGSRADGSYCDVRVPLAVAKRRAGMELES